MQVKILVVDDSATDRMIIKNMLSDYYILTACDGLEAMRILEEHDGIHLLILDLKMPNMNGFQVLEALKEDERYRKLRTIILTNYDELDNEIKGLKLGAVDYIRKPIQMASLRARIDVHAALLRAEEALEKALNESERSKSVFLSHLPGLAYRCNYDHDWTMQYVSEGCFNLTGYLPESLLYSRDLSYNEIISPEYREAIWNEWKRILAARQPFKYEYEIITATGARKWVLEMGQGIYNDDGAVEALEGIVLDISDRKALLIASEKSIRKFGKDFEICFYGEKLEAMVNRERDIVEVLSAIAANDCTNDALFLQYQPIMDLKKGSILGFEALARLRTGKLGLVTPLEFIPIAEKTKLILPIGEKIMVKAFRFLNRLKKLGYDEIGVSINISVIQLLSPDFTSRLFELINDMQVNPKNICLEITESVFASDFALINDIIKKLRDSGLYIAIDDFGTGHSSLAREKGLSVDCTKIDKFFIDHLLYSDPQNVITADIISIAHKLRHCTIAEGVEHESQLQYLKKHNCDRIQGYLISKPLDEDEAIMFLKKQG